MNGKELVFETLRHHDTPRPPWVPFAGIHAGKLIDASAKDILLDGDLLFKALMEVNKIYRPDGQPVLFDLQIEAEILGCELLWADYSPPSVATHPLAEATEAPCLCTIPQKTDGRLPMALDVMKRMKAAVGETTALYGLTTGPLTLASHLRGTNLFKDMKRNPEFAHALIQYCVEVNKALAGYYIEAGMDVIAAVDPVVSQISAKHFEEFLLDGYTELFNFIREKGVFSAFFVCGDATRNIEIMCHSKPDCIAVDENVDMLSAKADTDKHNIALCGNIPLTTTMLFGTQQDNMKFVVDLLDKLNHHNLMIAPGCDMPYDVPIENTVGAAQAVIETEAVRKMIQNYEAPADETIEVILPDYTKLIKPFIEVFTLDSLSCAACTYMMAAANDAKKHYGDRVDVIEYKYTEKASIARCKKVGVKNLPSMYINGQLKYSSIIPEQEELLAEIEKLL